MRRFVRDNSLTLVFGVLFLGALTGQAITGYANFNNGQQTSGAPTVSLAHYLTSASFATDVAENWQSEYLQFFLYIILTVWFIQKGSNESKPLDDVGVESDEQQHVGRYAREDSPRPVRAGGIWSALYSRSLGTAMGVFFLLSWLAQSIAGRAAYNGERLADHASTVSWIGYVTSADFWNRTLQNWQSEFLAVASMATLSIFLRQRGSPESKPVGTPHHVTGAEG
jgi:hypothetical protein